MLALVTDLAEARAQRDALRRQMEENRSRLEEVGEGRWGTVEKDTACRVPMPKGAQGYGAGAWGWWGCGPGPAECYYDSPSFSCHDHLSCSALTLALVWGPVKSPGRDPQLPSREAQPQQTHCKAYEKRQ